jgi:signal transduction histidine kinase
MVMTNDLEARLEHWRAVFSGDPIGERILSLFSSYRFQQRRLEKLEARLRNLKVLYDLGRVVSSILDLERLLKKVVDAALEVTGGERAFILLRRSEGGFDIVAASDVGGAPPAMEEFRFSEGVARKVLETGRPVCVGELEEDSDLGLRPSIVHLKLRSVMSVPLFVGSEVVGVITVDSTLARKSFTADELALFEALAGSAAIAIENARLYEELERQTRERERAQRLASLGKMAAGIAHEIRNPLAIINTAVFYLEATEDGADPERREQLRIIKEEIGRANRIIGDLLGFARGGTLELEEVELDALLAEIAESARSLPDLEQVRFETELEPGLGRAELDAERIRQVVFNLVRNAAQAVGPGGRVRLGARRSEPFGVVIQVADNGPGIPEEHLGRVFDPFFTTREKGTGLGLAICHTIVTQHGGRIEVRNQVQGGAVFTVHLPLKR